MAFSTVYKVIQPPLQYLAPKHFYHSKVKPVPIKQTFPHTSLHDFLAATHLTSASVDLFILDSPYTWNCTICDLLCLASIT